MDSLKRLEESGASAAVLPSLFEEQIEHDEREIGGLYESHVESFAESLSYFPEMSTYNTGSREYLGLIEQAKASVTMPIIGSLNGSSLGGWTRYAKLIEDAGADALELNVYLVPTDPDQTEDDVEQRYVELVANVAESVTIPVAVKIGAYFTSAPNFIPQLIDAGADGVVLFNRYLEPDIDLDTLEAAPNLVLSSRHELRLVLRWIAIMRDHVQASLAATSGVHFAEDVIKALLVGADVTMLATVLLRYGPPTIGKLIEETERWMEEHEYVSVDQMKGSMSHRNCPDPSALERANYMKALTSFTNEHPTA
jgi:dihydroorotate dehydrogenase (fumarate)